MTHKTKAPEAKSSGALSTLRRQLDRGILGSGFFVGLPSSERSQQNCADEHERRKGCQKIQIQGTVHEWPPLWLPMNKH
jgi:hypothetical protein